MPNGFVKIYVIYKYRFDQLEGLHAAFSEQEAAVKELERLNNKATSTDLYFLEVIPLYGQASHPQ